jgi:MSHA biogenesis protein MshP
MSTTHSEKQSERFVAAAQKAQRGIATIAAIFILVVLGGLGAFVVSLTTSQNINLAQDIESASAYQAARGGLEWGTARWLNHRTVRRATSVFPIPIYHALPSPSRAGRTTVSA